jgi:Holliday junction resolvasome RuvABC endonuclease subunit
MRLLALDLATHVGWAFFSERGATPKLGTWYAPKLPDRDRFGPIYSAFEGWLVRMIHTHAPSVIAFEAPILPRSKTFQKARAIRLSYGFAGSTERIAFEWQLRCIECAAASVKLRLAGHGHAKKPAMVAAAIRHGCDVATEDEADAFGVGLLAYDHVEPPQLELAT